MNTKFMWYAFNFYEISIQVNMITVNMKIVVTLLQNLPVPSQYILLVLLFLTKNKHKFLTNSQMHKITTRQTFDLYIPAANLTIYQKGVYYQGIKIYNHLPKTIKTFIW